MADKESTMNSDSEYIEVRGTREDLALVQEWLSKAFPTEGITLSPPTRVQPRPGERAPLRQVGLEEFLIGLGGNLLASLLYDQMKLQFSRLSIRRLQKATEPSEPAEAQAKQAATTPDDSESKGEG